MAKKVEVEEFVKFATTFFPDEAAFTDAQIKIAEAMLESRIKFKPVRMVREAPRYRLLPWVYGFKAIETPKIIHSHHFTS